MKRHVLLAGIAAMMLTACNQKTETTLTLSGLDPVKFQTTVNDAQTQLYTLKNKAGMEVCITNFGGRIVSIMVPDKNGVMQDVVLGFDITSTFQVTLVLLSDATPTGLTKGKSFLTEILYSYHRTISDIACTVAPKDGNTKYTVPIPLTAQLWSSPAFHRMETRISRVMLRQKYFSS
jgi:hypothetical protein